jgi:peptidyl-prolyl cis-trans isomerase C
MIGLTAPSSRGARLFGIALAAVLFAGLPARAATGAPAAADSALATFDGGAVYPAEFARLWTRIVLTQRPTGDLKEAAATFLVRVVDRKLLAQEVARRPFTPSPAEQRTLDATRDRLVQNLLFDRATAGLPDPTPDELDVFRRRQSSFAMARFIVFEDLDRARAWRHRLLTGTPMSVFEAAVQREGRALAILDDYRMIGAEQLDDSLAHAVWSLRPGQVSPIVMFGGKPTLVHLQKFEVRPSRNRGESDLKADYKTRQYDRVRESERLRLAGKLERRFEEDAMKLLLDAHLRVPPRNDVDPVSGIPVVRPNLPLPTVAPADTSRVLARTRHGDVTIGDYLHFFARVEPYARTEIRERLQLEGAVDRIAFDREILREALEQGLDKDPEVTRRVAEQREGYALDDFFREEIEKKIVVTEKEMRALWEKDPKHYNDLASLEGRLIAVDRRSLADSLLVRLQGGASFETLAREHSTTQTVQEDGGKTGIMYRGSQRNAGLENAMFATEVGALGGPEFTPEGWVIWKIDTKTPAVERTFEMAREMVERDARIYEGERLLQKRLEGMRKKAHAKFYPERIPAALEGWDM